ncbi:uncharacterized protein LOC109711510 isoform X2 [Ananas comosus]|uniref:Uncharacterized protein LOC109711510 isoform X2 n=1 Tax=Ananas comosus TaxID=4615 RepID=A0A6P5FA62_ANACO|nr:uncharacterized protein LOC109711510 isoform X2 [Ananas comosus]
MATSCFVAAQHLALPQRGLLSQQQQQQLRRRHAALHNCGRRNCWRLFRRKRRIGCYLEEPGKRSASAGGHEDSSATGIQLYSQIERIITETARQSQDGWSLSKDWSDIEGAWVLKPKTARPTCVVHFIGGIFVGAAPQLTYRFFLERLSEKGALVIATPFASGFDHFLIADEVQFKFDRCLRFLQEIVTGLPTFGVGHSLGSVIHLLIGGKRSCSIILSCYCSNGSKFWSGSIPANVIAYISHGEMAIKQLENFSPPIMRQVLPLLEQLPPLYMDLVKGREDFTPKPEETRRLIKSYYGVSRNLLIKFKDDNIDETPTLAQVLSSESAISSALDMSIRSMPGDHGLPLQQVIPDVPPAMADAVNRGGELIANLTAGTPWEAVAKEVGNTLGTDSGLLRAQISKDVNMLVDVIASWMASNSGPRILRP